MGKYRTFSNKVTHFDGALDPKKVGCLRNAKHRITPGKHLPAQKNGKWARSKESSLCKLSSRVLNPSFIIWLISASFLLLLQQCTAAPTGVGNTSSLISSVSEPYTSYVSPLKTEDLLVSTTEEFSSWLSPTPRNCTAPSSEEFPADLFTKEQRQHGAIAIHFFAVCYLLYALLLVCDIYFVPAIECICQELHIPPNIAGATFMAISTSAPELFTNVIGTFITKGDLGIGTIVGSAVFNVLAVGSCVGIGTIWNMKNTPAGSRNKRKGLPLEWWSLSRDTMYYILSVGILIGVLYDGRVYWYEAGAMIFVYGFYIAGMFYDAQCKQFVETCCQKVRNMVGCNDVPERKLSTVLKHKLLEAGDETSPLIAEANESRYGSSETSSYQKKRSHRLSLADVLSAPSPKETLDSSSFSSQSSNTTDSSVMSTVATLEALKDILSFPIRLALRLTIPDCRLETMKKWCGISLLCCVGWIGGLSYVISWMVCIIGETLDIPDSVSGLTFLAAGTSFPEVLSSVIVSRQGLASMGLSNSVGSNTFDILVCLGLPWLIQSIILTSHDDNFIAIHSVGMGYSAGLLITTMVVLYLLIAMNDYVLDIKVGVSCLVMYAVFITLACLLELNVFFPVNLPPC